MPFVLPDRRAALKARHRSALVAAARELLDEGGATGLTTDALAARADVSRRTVFNHFSNLEDVVVECIESELEAAIAAAEHDLGASERTAPLDDLVASVASPDLVPAVSWLGRVLSAPGREATAERVRQQAMHRFGAAAAERLRERHPDTDPLQLELLTTTVMNGLGVMAAAWLQETAGSLDPASRRRWSELLDVLFTSVRHGFAPATPHVPNAPTEGL